MLKVELEKKELPYDIEEELNVLRTNLIFSGSEKKVVMFTSCISGEGKSSTVLNLSRSLAALGKKVLMIDTDLRKSVLANRVVSGNLKIGLTHYLIGERSVEDVFYQTETENVFVLPAGAVPPNPTELLSNERMASLISSARKSFDYILIDCPPLGMVVDAAVIAPHCDGSIFLIASKEISRRFAQDVSRKLHALPCPVLGVVLNKVDKSESKQYGYGKYNKYYKK